MIYWRCTECVGAMAEALIIEAFKIKFVPVQLSGLGVPHLNVTFVNEMDEFAKLLLMK